MFLAHGRPFSLTLDEAQGTSRFQERANQISFHRLQILRLRPWPARGVPGETYTCSNRARPTATRLASRLFVSVFRAFLDRPLTYCTPPVPPVHGLV